ncbi:DUF4265 domain-containing protein [Pyxidicoccus fallax]|uniref:DUF4265 domain-containing protein n=1 Tax=Pyxidicoccus fallax TaxID=394095 RepID=A0A848LQ37_9BACT|nr:DUF4265 domain-containing protein [Pyxidicoccus fallax]NPC80882.1 DUF4265 domain-containing protein [Pyxidicoccus fallax]
MNARVKIRFPFTNSSGNIETETMWTVKREDGYAIDNIPFYAKELALGDVVSVNNAADGTLWHSELVRASGHSTIRLWMASESDVPRVRGELKRMGCASEVSDLPRLVAVDIPPNVPYGSVKAYLDEGRGVGTFEYQEACLGFM